MNCIFRRANQPFTVGAPALHEYTKSLMRSPLLCFVILIFVSACDVPKEIQNSPDNTHNTSGTTGSANATNAPATVGTGTTDLPDSAKAKRDSLP